MAGRTTLRLALLTIVLNSRLFVTAGTAGDDFTNNLFTDLAPLLGLFGEKFAQQFLAESFTVWDHVIFAMAPVGILTAIVGAIRVDGTNWLKQLVGRARETTAGAEIELMSSVSQEVCEVWNGTSIVRSMGAPQVKQIIHLPAEDGDFSPESFITTDRKTWSKGYELKTRYWSTNDTGSEKLSTNEDNNVDIELAHADNNDVVQPLRNEELINNKEIPRIYRSISTARAGVLLWSSYAQKHKLSGSNPSVGFPLQAGGTGLLTLGLVLCAGIIDNGSRERHWLIEGVPQVGAMSELLGSAKSKFKALANKLWLAKDKSLQERKHPDRRHMRLYWVQKQHIAGDNSFDPYILYAKELTDKVHESHRAKENGQKDQDDNAHAFPRAKENGQNDRHNKFLRKLLRPFIHHLTTLAVVIGLLGFVAQFQGLRFSNWSCSIAQLIALGVATVLRAWVRRSMTKTPVAIPANNDYILAHLTLAIVGRGLSDSIFPHHEAFRSPGLLLRFGISTCPKLKAIVEEPTNPESPPTTNVQDNSKSLPPMNVQGNSESPPLTNMQGNSESPPTTNLQDNLESPPTTNLQDNLESSPTTNVQDNSESPPPTNIQGNSESPPITNISDKLESPPTTIVQSDSESPPITNVQDKSESPPTTNVQDNSESPPTTNVQDPTEKKKGPNLAQEALNLRVRLGRITKWAGAKSQEAIVLSNSIETAVRRLSPRLPAEYGKKCAVVLLVDTYLQSTSKPDSQEEVELYIIRVGDIWKVDDGQLEALLSLVSYSAWAAKQNKRSGAEPDRVKSSESPAYLTKESSPEDSQTNGWLHAKTPDSRIYDIIVGTSSPRLKSDLRWWVSDTEQDLKKAKMVSTGSINRVFADFTGPTSDAESNVDKFERPALGHVNEETLKEKGMATIQCHLWRALISPDIYCSWKCDERQAFVLHIFSTFIWAIAPYVSVSQFHPTTVITSNSKSERLTRSGLDEAHLQSDNIETLVQRLQSTGLATHEEIYRMFIPPLSHFGKLPNEALADSCNEVLTEREVRLSWAATFEGYVRILDKVRDRGAQDRFSNRVAAMFVEFLLRVKEEPNPFTQEYLKMEFNEFNKRLRALFEDENLLKAILSVKDILACRWDPSKEKRAKLILEELGLEITPGKPQFPDLPQEGLRPSDDTSKERDYSFPNDTDVFGWTNEYWNIFETTAPLPASRFSECSALDLAGRSVLHHRIDSKRYPVYIGRMTRYLFADRNFLGDSSIFIARCNKQTPLHRAAIVGHEGVVSELLAQGIDPNAGDYFGRTALCLALSLGHPEVVFELSNHMSRDGHNRKDNDKRNALHYAILNGEEELAKSQIRRGVDINAEDIFSQQPLFYAGWYNMDSLIQKLLEEGVDRPVPVWRAEGYSHEELACFDELLNVWNRWHREQEGAQVAREEVEPERREDSDLDADQDTWSTISSSDDEQLTSNPSRQPKRRSQLSRKPNMPTKRHFQRNAKIRDSSKR